MTCEAKLPPAEIEELQAAVGHVTVSFSERAYRKGRDGATRRVEHVEVERTLLSVQVRADGWVDATFGSPST